MRTFRIFSWAFAMGLLASQLAASSGYAMNNAVDDEKEQGEMVENSTPNKPPVGLTAQQLNEGYAMMFKGNDNTVAMWRWKGNQQNVSLAEPLTVKSLTSVAFEPEQDRSIHDVCGGCCWPPVISRGRNRHPTTPTTPCDCAFPTAR